MLFFLLDSLQVLHHTRVDDGALHFSVVSYCFFRSWDLDVDDVGSYLELVLLLQLLFKLAFL